MNPHHLDIESIASAFRAALRNGIIREEDSALLFYDLDFLTDRLRHLTKCFPSGSLHALAVKANPLTRVMKIVRDISPGIGVEAASIGEVTLALKCGYPPGCIVYDSPVKTRSELDFALRSGIGINIDSFHELERVKALYEPGNHGTIGLRINPQVGTGKILESSVAGEYSKFGVPVRQHRAELMEAYLNNAWLTGVHLHVGSQGCPLALLTEGIGVLYDFIMEVNEKRQATGLEPVSVFDIGGGLPIAYHVTPEPPPMEDYWQAVIRRAPEIERFRIVTEFGRWAYTNSGWTVSRVEYVKREDGINTAMIHVGADLFLRECLNPKDWSHRYSVLDANGAIKTGTDPVPYNLAGPLCFSGDILATRVSLPVIEEGDYVIIHDTGGYTFSMWSRYNSRQSPRIAGYHGEHFTILKERESLEELHRFWE